MKKLKLFTLIPFITLALASCAEPKEITNSYNNVIDTLAVEAVSSVSLVSNESISLISLEETTNINPYDVISKTNGLLKNSIEIKDDTLDKEGYEAKKILVCNEEEYIMYISSVKTEVEEEKEEDDDEEETEVETNTSYDGVVVHKGVEYPFVVRESVEIEGNEEEKEISMTLTYNENEKITIKRSIEKEEDEYEEAFMYFKNVNGSEREFLKVKRSLEDNEEEIKIIENNIHTKLTYYTKDLVNYVDIVVDNDKATFKIVEENNEIAYILV